jgi:hypothetical protein
LAAKGMAAQGKATTREDLEVGALLFSIMNTPFKAPSLINLLNAS